MKVTVWCDRTDAPVYRGGFADVWKGVYCGRDVAVKVIRTYPNSDLQKIVGVSYWLCPLLVCLCTDNAPCRGSARKS